MITGAHSASGPHAAARNGGLRSWAGLYVTEGSETKGFVQIGHRLISLRTPIPLPQTFTADELNTALTTVMSNLNIQPGPPSQPVTAEDFRTAFATAMQNMVRQV